MKFFIPGPLPGLNEIIQASKKEIKWLRRGKKRCYEITQLKEIWTNRVAACFMKEFGIPRQPMENKISLYCEWIEPNSRRDPDNVFAGVKFILDGLETTGFIKRDSRKWISGINNVFGKNDSKFPGVVVRIFE